MIEKKRKIVNVIYVYDDGGIELSESSRNYTKEKPKPEKRMVIYLFDCAKCPNFRVETDPNSGYRTAYCDEHNKSTIRAFNKIEKQQQKKEIEQWFHECDIWEEE